MNCSRLILTDLQFSAALPLSDAKKSAPQKKAIGPNTLRAAEIHASVLENIEEIIKLKQYMVGVRTIIKTLGLVGTPSTVDKHYNAVLLELKRVVGEPTVKRFNDFGVKRRQHKQDGIKFGAHL